MTSTLSSTAHLLRLSTQRNSVLHRRSHSLLSQRYFWVNSVCFSLRRPGASKTALRTTDKRFSTLIRHDVEQNSERAPRPTIYALSSAAGRAAIAVIRISGPASADIYRLLCPDQPLPRPRYAALRTLREPRTPVHSDFVLDTASIVLFFPGPRTVTGEDVLELHVHGGPAVVKAVLAAISHCLPSNSGRTASAPSVRYAEPGEFTRQAFLNGRLDLTQIEALGDTLAADTEQQRRLSIRGAGGRLARQYESWRQLLLYARGELEALIDFSEDQHFDESPVQLAASVASQVERLRKYVKAYSENAVRGELLRNGIGIALLGAPNAGKSSLLNRIVGREAAIVSTAAGTTRDVVEVGVDIGGWYCKLGDTAGLRARMDPTSEFSPARSTASATVGEIEQEGIRRAKEKAWSSDVVVLVIPIEKNVKDGVLAPRLNDEVISTAAALNREHGNVFVVVNKMDRVRDRDFSLPEAWVHHINRAIPELPRNRLIGISCQTSGSELMAADAGNIQNCLSSLSDMFKELTSPVTFSSDEDSANSTSTIATPSLEESLGASERQRLLLVECLVHLDNFLSEVKPHSHDFGGEPVEEVDVVVAAERLRAAADCLARITGHGDAGDAEEVLGVVFEK
ncbi:MAG: tRNA modification GTPase gtpbp3, mitochondrial [Caeruleum heppii]|nr:MAG: tRNA modification GTPase gtpbp3, mitochondrial [Caeruleum heppii]